MTDATYCDDVGLSPQQLKIYKYMWEAGRDVDVAIVSIHLVLDVKPQKRSKSPSDREMQQLVGSAVSRVNKKIKALGHVIVPGRLKHTYRLTAVQP